MFFRNHQRRNTKTELTLIRMQEVALWHNWKLSVKTGKENGKEEQQNGSLFVVDAKDNSQFFVCKIVYYSRNK